MKTKTVTVKVITDDVTYAIQQDNFLEKDISDIISKVSEQLRNYLNR